MPAVSDMTIAALHYYPFDMNVASGLATVLLVDVDPNILRPLRLLVSGEGYLVLTVGDGEAALAVAAIESPGLIVADWMMSHVNGVELSTVEGRPRWTIPSSSTPTARQRNSQCTFGGCVESDSAMQHCLPAVRLR